MTIELIPRITLYKRGEFFEQYPAYFDINDVIRLEEDLDCEFLVTSRNANIIQLKSLSSYNIDDLDNKVVKFKYNKC